MVSLQSQLLQEEREWLRSFAGDAGKPFVEELARAWDYRAWKADHGYAPERLDELEASRRLHYPQWSAEQCGVALAIENVCEAANLGLAVTLRILREEPAELGLGLILTGRLLWLSRRLAEQSGMGSEDDDLSLIPLALGARDIPLAERAAASRFPAGLRKEEINKLLGQGFTAILRRDLPALQPVVERLGKRKVDRSMKWMVECLQGMAAEDPVRVTGALEQSLREAQRDRKKEEAQFPISLETHQYYGLARWLSPGLVAGFDGTQPLPWDAGLHAWQEEHPKPLSGLDLSSISPVLHAAVVDLKLPDWWRVLEEPESPQDTCRLVLHQPGPQPNKVREMVDAWARVRQWPPVSLDTYPVVLTEDLPRLNAWMMRRSLLEIGAQADFECVRRAGQR